MISEIAASPCAPLLLLRSKSLQACPVNFAHEALGGALELKGAETEAHCQRVTAYTISIAKNVPVPLGKRNNNSPATRYEGRACEESYPG